MQIRKDIQEEIKSILSDKEGFISGTIKGKQKASSSSYRKIDFKQVELKDDLQIQFAKYDDKKVYHKNESLEEAYFEIVRQIEQGFTIVQFHTTEADKELIINGGKMKMKTAKATKSAPASKSHDRKKEHILSREEKYDFLFELGIQDETGKIKTSMSDKFVQLNKFLEIVENELQSSYFADKKELNIIDYGCGKSYLTFALYYYLTEQKGIKANITGVDFNCNLVKQCKTISSKLGFDGLNFAHKTIANFEPEINPDIVISLHACNTATDDIIAKAIKDKTKMIMSVPCCQQEFFKKLHPTEEGAKQTLSFGLTKERIAALLTDNYRCLTLQEFGFKTAMTEFVDAQHSGKNILITAVQTKSYSIRQDKKTTAFKKLWGLKDLYLDNLLK